MTTLRFTLAAVAAIFVLASACVGRKPPSQDGDAYKYTSCSKCPRPGPGAAGHKKIPLVEDKDDPAQAWVYKVGKDTVLAVQVVKREGYLFGSDVAQIDEHLRFYTKGGSDDALLHRADHYWIFELQSSVAGAQPEFYWLTGYSQICNVHGKQNDKLEHPLESYNTFGVYDLGPAYTFEKGFNGD